MGEAAVQTIPIEAMGEGTCVHCLGEDSVVSGNRGALLLLSGAHEQNGLHI